jgi:hypothetical protein
MKKLQLQTVILAQLILAVVPASAAPGDSTTPPTAPAAPQANKAPPPVAPVTPVTPEEKATAPAATTPAAPGQRVPVGEDFFYHDGDTSTDDKKLSPKVMLEMAQKGDIRAAYSLGIRWREGDSKLINDRSVEKMKAWQATGEEQKKLLAAVDKMDIDADLTEAELWLRKAISLEANATEGGIACVHCRRQAAYALSGLFKTTGRHEEHMTMLRSAAEMEPHRLQSEIGQELYRALKGKDKAKYLHQVEALAKASVAIEFFFKQELASAYAGELTDAVAQKSFKSDWKKAAAHSSPYMKTGLRAGLLLSGAAGKDKIAEGITLLEEQVKAVTNETGFREVLRIIEKFDKTPLKKERHANLAGQAMSLGLVDVAFGAAKYFEGAGKPEQYGFVYREIYNADGRMNLATKQVVKLTPKQKATALAGWKKAAAAIEKKTGVPLSGDQKPPEK